MASETELKSSPVQIIREKKNAQRVKNGEMVIYVPADKTAQWHLIDHKISEVVDATGLSKPTVIQAMRKQFLKPKATTYTIDMIDWALGIISKKPSKK